MGPDHGDLLHIHCDKDPTLPVDKVYALLGLAEETIPAANSEHSTHSALIPNYASHCFDVYQNVTRILVERDRSFASSRRRSRRHPDGFEYVCRSVMVAKLLYLQLET